jgi:tRNA(Ile)-lysidine synthase
VSTVEEALREEEASVLFDGLENLSGLVLAVSGGPDSTALLLMAARWAQQRKKLKKPAPALLAITIDHGLRPQAAREARAVKQLARRLGVPHRTLRWSGKKPAAGLQEVARLARYRLLASAAARSGYKHILTAHTLDDQAETVLFRLARGSGMTGLAGMARITPLPVLPQRQIFLVRPLLGIAKARLLATLAAGGIGYSEDPTNRDPRFTRARLRALMPALAREGLDARGLARLSGRMRRAEAAIEFAVDAAAAALSPPPWAPRGPIAFAAVLFGRLPAEVGLRLLGRAIAQVGDEGPVELAKLEQLYSALVEAQAPIRRTLAGALVTLTRERLIVERAPPRQARRRSG